MSPAQTEPHGISTTADEAHLLARLRAGDEAAFAQLVDGHYSTMLAVALGYVKSRAVAEEVVQEAWIGALRGLDGFEGRSSLKTWLMRIVANMAMARADKEARSVPFSALAFEGDEPAVDPERFRGAKDAYPGHWRAYPSDWGALPEDALLEREALATVVAAIGKLPPAQRTVITLRDVYGCGAGEVCEALEMDAAYQRVLLHRARARVRARLEEHVDG